MTRKQFEEMTADLLEETIRITNRTLDEAEERYPGIRSEISQLLLVGGSSWMPAVRERLQAGIQLGAAALRPGPRGRQGRGAVRGRTDSPVRRRRRGRRAQAGSGNAAADASGRGAGLPAPGR